MSDAPTYIETLPTVSLSLGPGGLQIGPAMKPLGRKAYGHIGHLPGSRLGPGDHTVSEGQARICLEAFHPQRKSDRITVTEKLDGSCVAVAMIDGCVTPLIRAGYLAVNSHYEQHRMFANWVFEHQDQFRGALREGERIVGEWIAQAHGTLYDVEALRLQQPFVAFDLMRGDERATRDEFCRRVRDGLLEAATCIHDGGPLPLEVALAELGVRGFHGADEAEGVVYRVESKRRKDGPYYVDFLAKYVRHGKVDGKYLPDVTGSVTSEPVWNWRP